jgi:4-amino-4-deoxychorismate lyase
MPLLVESLRADDGIYDSLEPHIRRMTNSCLQLFGMKEPPDLIAALTGPEGLTGPGRWKVRVLYDTRIHAVEAELYRPGSYNSAALVDGGRVAYPHKTVERVPLDALTRRAQAAGADTALIVSGGLITDFTYANAAFFDGNDWYTPAHPLLQGTRRDRLLAQNRVQKADIPPSHLYRYLQVSPINAMLDLGEIVIDISNIILTGKFSGIR